MELDPGTVVHEGPLWTVAVNRNQDLLGKVMLVLRRRGRPCGSFARTSGPPSRGCSGG